MNESICELITSIPPNIIGSPYSSRNNYSYRLLKAYSVLGICMEIYRYILKGIMIYNKKTYIWWWVPSLAQAPEIFGIS